MASSRISESGQAFSTVQKHRKHLKERENMYHKNKFWLFVYKKFNKNVQSWKNTWKFGLQAES